MQLCIVHQVRKMRYVPWKERKEVAAGLRAIYSERGDGPFGARYVRGGLEREVCGDRAAVDWARLAPFFDYPPAIRKAVYTTNAVESLNYSLRRIVKDKGAFPNDEAIFKLLWLGLREASKKWKRPIRDWKAALNQFVILYGDRVPIEQ